MIRRLLPLVGVLIALSSTAAHAEDPVITWTCAASNTDTWPMHQPQAHFDAGNYPRWSDCEAWRNGNPGPDYVWSYGPVATTTTTSSSTTTTAPATTTTESSTTSTTPPTTTTLPEPTTTAPEAPETTTTQPQVTTTMQMVSTTIQPIQQTTAGSPTTYPPTTAETTSTTQSPTTNAENPSITAYTTSSSSLPERSTTTTVAPTLERAADPLPAILNNLDTVTPTEAATLFAALNLDTLTDEQAAALVAAVQNAPTAIRAAFEAEVNIFAGKTDTYIPLGSRVPVQTRRIIIITTGLLVAMPTPRRTR